MKQLNQTQSKLDTINRPVRTARTFVHRYNGTQYCSTETVLLNISLPPDQHHISDVVKWRLGGEHFPGLTTMHLHKPSQEVENAAAHLLLNRGLCDHVIPVQKQLHHQLVTRCTQNQIQVVYIDASNPHWTCTTALNSLCAVNR